MPQTTIKLSQLQDWSIMNLTTRAKIGSEFLHLSNIEKIQDENETFYYKVKFQYDLIKYMSVQFDQKNLPVDKSKYDQIEVLLNTPTEAYWEDESHEIDPITKKDCIVAKEASVTLYYGNNLRIEINDRDNKVVVQKKKDKEVYFSSTNNCFELTIEEASALIKDFNTIYNRYFNN